MNSFKKMELYGERTAVYAERAYSYAEMAETGDSICRAVGERTLVFCLCSNTPASVFGYIGFIRGGVVPVLLDANLSFEQLSSLIERYKPTYIWASAEHEALKSEMETTFLYDDYALFHCPNTVKHQLHKELALLLTTSGSTGSPKLVRLSYDNVFSNAESIATYLEIGADDQPITTLPMNYSYGLSILNSHFIKGATVVLTQESILKREFWELCREQKVTTFGGVPFVYEMLDKLNFGAMELPFLKKLTQAGGKLNPKLAEKFAAVCREKGIQFYIMYGQTEATARMSYLPSEKCLDKMGSIGVAIPGGQLLVHDESGGVITEPYVSGELIYRGPNVSFGYAESFADLVKADDNNGILHTGDVAYVDEEGYFYITGRMKRMIKLYGNRISLDEVEALLKAYGHDCVCAGTDDALKIYTVHDDTVAIKSIMKEKLNIKGYKIIRIAEIPRNAFGKPLYTALP
ncbi:MAG: AMP-binding protein [Bacilli bacterium]